ncbi:MAG: molybdopterin biosynthesis protein [Deltaproteobacteria bacterium]|nr:molybdopterin biosynthesis protein [Deltaproteobacteria bacterium]
MTNKRNIYLKKKSLKEARQIMFDAFLPGLDTGSETINTTVSAGRVLAKPVFAAMSSPGFNASAMDGIAVAAEKTYGASETSPKTLEVGKDAFFVNTGHVLPKDTNAVIMIEHVQEQDESSVIIEAPAFPWQYVRKMGEDIVATQLLFPSFHRITPSCVGALITAGIFTVEVIRKPRILVMPTGSELLDASCIGTEELPLGKVIESNSYVLSGMAEKSGAECVRHPIVADDFSGIGDEVKNAVSDEFDMVLIIGGSSAGSEDFARAIIDEAGETLIHGVTIMPGKPVIVGRVGDKPVFGMPGYPVSAIIAFEQFVRPLIYAALHINEPEDKNIIVAIPRKLPSRLGIEEFVRVKIGRVDDRFVANPLPRGAGSITSITEADGIIRIDAHSEGIAADETAPARLLTDKKSIQNTIMVVGSHDNSLDVLADLIRRKSGRFSLSSSHVGSMGGLAAVKKGLCHLAGTHLLDTKDGSYNVSYIRRYLSGTDVRLIHLAGRDQGLIIAKSNPKKIQGIEDLIRGDIRFINRQPGSGTRILFDFHLDQKGLSAPDINGYTDEEFTHMAVAVSVLSGNADAGMGIFAAAKALGLDFIPVARESYDLLIPERFIDSEPIRELLDVIRSAIFISRVSALGGYHMEETGKEVFSCYENPDKIKS